LPDDDAKHTYANPALMAVVHALEDYAEEHGPPVVVIPGEDRLPFFFPDWEIRNRRDADTLPTTYEDLDGADIFVDNSVYMFLLSMADKLPNSLLADAGVGATYHRLNVLGWDGEPWPTVLEPIPLSPDGSVGIDDGNFRYAMYVLNPDARTAPMQPQGLREDEVIVGGFTRFIGHDVVTLEWVRGAEVVLSLYWQPTDAAPPSRDYSIFVQLTDEDGGLLTQWEGAPLQGEYYTRFWRPGESLLDYWILSVPEDLPPGPARLRIGIYDPIAGDQVGMEINGRPAPSILTINTRIEIE
jgi:hypothetical protein